MNKYPALTIGVITTVVTSTIILLTSFGVPITPDQQQAINGFVAALAPLVTGLVIFYRNSRAERRQSERTPRR